MQNLKALSKSSARLATFAVRLFDGESETYTFTSKKSGQLTIANKFEVTLVGKIPEEYCKGYVKASKDECNKATEKFKDGTVWALSKVVFDPFSDTTLLFLLLATLPGR